MGELAKMSVLTRRGEAAAHPKLLERSEATDLWRNRDHAVAAQLLSNGSATSESATATHVQVRQLHHDQHARRDFGEGVVEELMATASKQQQETTRGAPRARSRASAARCCRTRRRVVDKSAAASRRRVRRRQAKKKTHKQLGRIALHSLLLDAADFFRHIKSNFVV